LLFALFHKKELTKASLRLFADPLFSIEINELASAQTASDFSRIFEKRVPAATSKAVELQIMMIEFIVCQGVFCN
jgi:hypothetical protein